MLRKTTEKNLILGHAQKNRLFTSVNGSKGRFQNLYGDWCVIILAARFIGGVLSTSGCYLVKNSLNVNPAS